MAGAPVSTATRQLVKSIIPNGEVFTPYGATEALPVTLAPAQELEKVAEEAALSGERGTLVGKVIPGVEALVVPITADRLASDPKLIALPPYEIGELLVRGDNINARYFDSPEADAKGKVVLADCVWHRMGDVCYLDKVGNIYFCGRKAHIVMANGRRYFSIPVERIFNQHAWVRRSALICVGSDDVGVVIEPLPENWPATEADRETFLQELRTLGATSEITRSIEHFYFHTSFPVDARHNAKIFRDKLGDWVKSQSVETRFKKVA